MEVKTSTKTKQLFSTIINSTSTIKWNVIKIKPRNIFKIIGYYLIYIDLSDLIFSLFVVANSLN